MAGRRAADSPNSGLPKDIDRVGNKYRARYRDEEGKRHSKTFDRLRDAVAWREDQRSAVRKGTHIAPRDLTTVGEYAERWNGARIVRPTTAAYRVNALATLKASPLGRMVLSQVRPSDVQAYVGALGRTKAPSTINRHYGWLKSIFASALEDRLISFTPCTSRISLTTIERPRIVPLTVAQIYDLAGATTDRYRIGMILHASLGLRISELLGLQLRDVDWMRRVVTIDRQLAKDGKSFVAPKTEFSRRTIPLPQDVALELSAHLQRFPARDDGLILFGPKGAPVRLDRWSQDVFRPAAKAAGLPDSVTSHDLRHAFASEALSRGVPANVVAQYMGHADAALVIRTYGHVMPNAEDVMRKALDAAWSADGSNDGSRQDASSS
jgi:integrase